eukprot:scaffold81250_cov17-Tisochrysis_lutea.AAC.2
MSALDVNQLNELKMDELKEMARERGVKVRGTKPAHQLTVKNLPAPDARLRRLLSTHYKDQAWGTVSGTKADLIERLVSASLRKFPCSVAVLLEAEFGLQEPTGMLWMAMCVPRGIPFVPRSALPMCMFALHKNAI